MKQIVFSDLAGRLVVVPVGIRGKTMSGGVAPDITAPTISSPLGTQTGSTTATIGATTNEANGTLYYVITASATAPSAAQVEAGQNNAGTAAIKSGSQAITATGAKTFGVTGLTASTAYFAHFMHKDAAGNRSTVLSSAQFTTAATPDTTAPLISAPVGTQTGSTTATIGATTDEANGTFYGVVTTSATVPSAAQIEAGQNHLGAAAVFAGSGAVSSTGAKTLSATGLTGSTAYYAHLMHKDAAGNRSNVVSSAQFTTASGGSVLDNSIPAPTLSLGNGVTTYPPQINVGLPPEYQVGTHQIRFQGDDDYLFGSTFINDALNPNDTQATAQAYIDSALASISSGTNFFRARIEWVVSGTTHYTDWSNVQGHGDAVAPTISSSTSGTSAERVAMSMVVTASEPVLWALSGTDAGVLELSTAGPSTSTTVRLISNAILNYENKTAFAFNVTATDPSGNTTGPVAHTFAVTDVDEVPATPSFSNQTNATLSASYTSNAVTISGLAASTAVPISVAGGQYQKSTDSGATWGAATSVTGTVQNSDQVRLVGTAPAVDGNTTTVTVAIGDPQVSANFRIVTPGANPDIAASSSTPAAQTGAAGYDFLTTNHAAGLPILGIYSGAGAAAVTVNGGALTKVASENTSDRLEMWIGSAVASGSYTDHVDLVSNSVCAIIPCSGLRVSPTPIATAKKAAGGGTHATTTSLTVNAGEIGIVFVQCNSTAAVFGGGVTQLAKWTSGGDTYLLGKMTASGTPGISGAGLSYSTMLAVTLASG